MKTILKFWALICAAFVFVVCGCAPLTKALGYNSIDACIAGKVYTADYCKKAFSMARAAKVPKYKTLAGCAKRFDNCGVSGDGYSPNLGGVMLSGRNDPVPLYKRGGFYTTPSAYYLPDMNREFEVTSGDLSSEWSSAEIGTADIATDAAVGEISMSAEVATGEAASSAEADGAGEASEGAGEAEGGASE